MASYFESLSKSAQFVVLVGGVFLFFGIHNFLQEAIMHLPEFHFGWFLGFMEVLGVTVCCQLERQIKGDFERKSSFKSYLYLALCLMGSSSLSNIALNYINFPVKVVFRSCKLIPTMLAAIVMNKKHFSMGEYLTAICVCVGLVLFGWADAETSPNFHLGGITLVTASVLCDAILPNLQEQLFGAGSSRLEVTYWTNIFCLGFMTISLGASGDLIGAFTYALTSPMAAAYFLIYTMVAYVAIGFHMNVVKRFGGVVAVFVGNSRKAMTIVISYLVFPKPFTFYYAVGAVLVFGGVVMNVVIKDKQKQAKQVLKANHSDANIDQALQQVSRRPSEYEKGVFSKSHSQEQLSKDANKVQHRKHTFQ